MNSRVTHPERPFDPGHPHDAMAETFRRQIIALVQDAQRFTIYREMSPKDQLSSFMSGAITALIGIGFVSVRDDARDIIMKSIADALPMARKQAEDIIANSREKS